MPILQVRALPQKDPSKISKALKKTCEAIASAYGCEISHVWATWDEIKPGFYFDGNKEAEMQPDQTHPPIVQLICFEGKTAPEIEYTLLAASKTLSKELGIPDNIFATYHEFKSGRVVAGDGVVRK